MRGLAVLTAAASCWVLVRGLPPVVGRLRLQPPDALGLALGAAAAIGVSFLAFALLGIPSVALALGILAASVPVTMRNERRRRAEASVRDRWPDVLMYIRSSLSAGGTLEDATIDAMQKVGAPFDTYAERVRAAIAFGGGYAHGMEAIREELDDPTTDGVVATLTAASGTGGRRVSETVSALASATSDDLQLRKAHEASLTEQRWTVNVALVAPWVLLCLALATNPQAAAAFETAEAALVVAIGLAATTVGWLLARRTARLSRPPRVFR